MASDTRGNSIDSRRPGRRPVAAGPARTTATVVAMLRPVSLLPALVAVVATLSTAAPAVADKPVAGDPNGAVDRHAAAERLVASRAQARTAPARPRAVQRDPLAVTISEITPSSIPARGPIEVRGSVTNRSQDPFTAINLHAFMGGEPMTTSAELAEAALLDPSVYVGNRITAPGTFDSVDELAPGQSSSFTIRVPQSQITATTPGVYWFGVHALGDSVSPRDDTADGRARTFLALAPDTRRPVKTALVIPLRHRVEHEADGSIADVEGWAEALSTGGALRSLLEFGGSAGTRPISWLIDPAVPDTVRALVAGNPPRSLDDTLDPDRPADDEGGSASPSPTEGPSTPAEGEDGEEKPPPTNAATEPGSAWLNQLEGALAGDEVLGLPYGDVDVSAAAQLEPDSYDLAVQRTGNILEPWGFPLTPAIAPPGGYLDPESLDVLGQSSPILVSDRMFPEGAPPVARVSGTRLTTTSRSTEQGGPGPGLRLTALALRQRILAETAVRAIDPTHPPLVVVLPQRWRPESTLGFFGGLDVDWLDLVEIGEISDRRGRPVDAETLTYPDAQARHELDAANFSSATALAAAGETLQNVLTRNNTVAAAVTDESLTTLSYARRTDPNSARADAERSRAWITARLESITVEAPRAVTLASTSGRFAATVSNSLDHPVTVSLQSLSEQPMTIDGPETIDIAAESSTSVLMRAATDRLGVHRVELLVTDEEGTPIGSTDNLPIRSVQVSQLIWVILGTGVALLFGAIAVRLVRRVRRATR